MKELDKNELQLVEGGCELACLIVAGLVVAGGSTIMLQWDDFKDGFASAFD